MKKSTKTYFSFLSIMFALLFLSSNAFASDFEGSWLLNDTHGGSFVATLDHDGTASGTHGDSMKHGTWTEKDGSAIIKWNTGWTTCISKDGQKYVKTSFKPGSSLTDPPTDKSDAKKKN